MNHRREITEERTFVLRSETEGNGWTIGSLHNVRRLATGQMYSMLGDSSARFDHVRGWRTSWTRTACVAQQIREAFPWDTAPPYLIRDQDGAYGQSFRSTVTTMGVEEVVTAPRSPWQNPYVERLIGSVRPDCLDHSIILNERHCLVWTPPVLQGENRFETAVELAVMYPAFSLRYTDRWP